jgi:hypothetical protein
VDGETQEELVRSRRVTNVLLVSNCLPIRMIPREQSDFPLSTRSSCLTVSLAPPAPLSLSPRDTAEGTRCASPPFSYFVSCAGCPEEIATRALSPAKVASDRVIFFVTAIGRSAIQSSGSIAWRVRSGPPAEGGRSRRTADPTTVAHARARSPAEPPRLGHDPAAWKYHPRGHIFRMRTLSGSQFTSGLDAKHASRTVLNPKP